MKGSTKWTTRTEYIDSETGEILMPSYAKKQKISLMDAIKCRSSINRGEAHE